MMSEEEALDVWAEANEFSPDLPDWGFFTLDANPMGVGGFTWFLTQEDMFKFFWEVVPPAMATDSRTKVRKMVHACREHVSRHELGETSLEQLVECLNKSLTGVTQILWIGTFGEMTNGAHRYCQAMRARFHAHRAEGTVVDEHKFIDEDSSPNLLAKYGKPIPDADLEDFRDFLQEWGC